MTIASANSFTPAAGAFTASPRHQAWMDALATVCVNCEHVEPGRLYCDERKERIDTFIMAGKPFCPLGKHNDLEVETTGLIHPPLKRPAEPPRPPWTQRWFGKRLCRLMGDRVHGWLATKPPHYISGALKCLLVCRGVCRPPADVVRARLSKCHGSEILNAPCCKYLRRRFGINVCDKCGCMINAKARLASEQCPEGKWRIATGKDCRWWRALLALGWIEPPAKGCNCGRRGDRESPRSDNPVPAAARR